MSFEDNYSNSSCYEEHWKKFKYKDEETNYSISDLGRVRNDLSGRFLRMFIQNNGYYGFTISVNNKPHSFKIARQVALYFIPNPDYTIFREVNHKDATRKDDNSVYNLEWVTPDENKRDAHRQSLYRGHKGETNWNSIYTNDQIAELCRLMELDNLELGELSRVTGVSKETIADVYHGARWSCVSKHFNVKNYTKLPINSNKIHSVEQVEGVCRLMDLGFTNKEIRRITGFSKDSVERLRKGKTFKDISCKYNFIKNKCVK